MPVVSEVLLRTLRLRKDILRILPNLSDEQKHVLHTAIKDAIQGLKDVKEKRQTD
jgi:hypothetical protein